MNGNDTLLTALSTILSLQRWNFLPRIETWVEAENAVYVTHVGYALGRVKGMTTDHLLCFMHRNLLKSLSKHFTTDIPVPIRERIEHKDAAAWKKLVDRNAMKTSALFPRELAMRIRSYLEKNPSYDISSQKGEQQARAEVESLISYAQNRVARDECRTNENVFPSEYGSISKDIDKRIADIAGSSDFTETYTKMREYFVTIKRLKYLRRWNRINRVIHTSVLAHTYLVTVLAVVISWLEEKRIKADSADWTTFQYKTALRALFHDLPESLTSDVISPVKEYISAINKDIWPYIEDNYTKEFVQMSPPPVREDIETHGLLKELDTSKPFTVDSIVKDCDRLALVLECAYERDSGRMNAEMIAAYQNYVLELQKSEWRSIREFLGTILDLFKQ